MPGRRQPQSRRRVAGRAYVRKRPRLPSHREIERIACGAPMPSIMTGSRHLTVTRMAQVPLGGAVADITYPGGRVTATQRRGDSRRPAWLNKHFQSKCAVAQGGLVSSQTDTPADPCAAVLLQVEEDKVALAGQERRADREAQEQAAKKAHAAELLTLLDEIDPATTAWDAAKDDLTAAVSTLWAELAPCLPTLDASLGDDKDCMKKAYNGYGEWLATLRADLRKRNEAAATAAASADAAAAKLAEAQDLLSQRYAQFATYMGKRRDDLQAAAQSFKAAMGSHPCDARTAYILLRETQDIFKDFKEQAAKCLPEEMRELIMHIDRLQVKARAAQTAKLQADDEAKQASAAVDAAATDKADVILKLFAKCKSDGSAPSPVSSSSESEV